VAVAAQECNYSVKKSTSNMLEEVEGPGDDEEIDIEDDGTDAGDDSVTMGLPGKCSVAGFNFGNDSMAGGTR
jgi:hypothetical protein